jgi:glycosyltransferase involved in cell wall biosynthesis
MSLSINIENLIKSRSKINNTFDVTFFVPALNEQNSIITTLNKIVSVASRLNITYEIIVVNDGSKDNTKNLIENYINEHSELSIRAFHNSIRRGLGYNYVDASFHGFGKYYIMICGDNSETEESIVELLNKKGKADIIIPYFGDRDTRNIIRKVVSRIFSTMVNLISGNKIKYYNGTVLHLRKNLLRWHPMATGFAYQAELLDILINEKRTYLEVQISNNDREVGYSKAFYLQNYLSIVHSLLQILLRRTRRTIWPT